MWGELAWQQAARLSWESRRSCSKLGIVMSWNTGSERIMTRFERDPMHRPPQTEKTEQALADVLDDLTWVDPDWDHHFRNTQKFSLGVPGNEDRYLIMFWGFFFRGVKLYHELPVVPPSPCALNLAIFANQFSFDMIHKCLNLFGVWVRVCGL